MEVQLVTPTLYDAYYICLYLFLLFFFLKMRMSLKILKHLEKNYSYFYSQIYHRDDSAHHVITSGKSLLLNLDLLFSNKYELDEYLKRKISYYKLFAILEYVFFIIFIVLAYNLGYLHNLYETIMN